jgi:transposase
LSRRDLSEAEWRLLEPLLPPERGRKNRSAFDNRRIVNGILWRIRTGAVARSAREVRQADDGLSALRRSSDAGTSGKRGRHDPCPGDGRQLPPQSGFDDGSRSCLGCRRKRGTREQAFGRSRGGFTCKVHCLRSCLYGVGVMAHDCARIAIARNEDHIIDAQRRLETAVLPPPFSRAPRMVIEP